MANTGEYFRLFLPGYNPDNVFTHHWQLSAACIVTSAICKNSVHVQKDNTELYYCIVYIIFIHKCEGVKDNVAYTIWSSACDLRNTWILACHPFRRKKLESIQEVKYVRRSEIVIMYWRANNDLQYFFTSYIQVTFHRSEYRSPSYRLTPSVS